MPFDVGDFPGASSSDRAASRRSRLLVATWLLTLATMVLVMIALGGLTRLTGSGLSIMEWAPLLGAIPPLSEAEWQRLFALYRRIPQYALINADFGLGDFRRIFWLEWAHRLWGRVLGLAFIAPLAWLWIRGHLSRRLMPRIALFILLGGLQGTVGWFMVASGFFPDATTVSVNRLVIHLSLAVMLYGALLWTGLDLLFGPPNAPRSAKLTHNLAGVTCGLVVITILAGGLVAGKRAGLAYNTFPLMDGQLIPATYGDLQPFLLNFTENAAAVQFNHRLLASATLIFAVATGVAGMRISSHFRSFRSPVVLLALSLGQYGLGIVTLLLVIPIAVAIMHQVGAILLFTVTLVLLHLTRVPRTRLG